MEPVEAKITFRYTIQTKVVRVFERLEKVWKGGTGSDASFTNLSKGWFVSLEGSYEALSLGKDKPGLVAGDKIKITLEKV